MIFIYLCEDSGTWLDHLVKVIENYLMINPLNAKILCATQDPQTLLQTLQADPSRMGLYFLDVNLNHRLSGFDLAQEIRRLDPRSYIVFITAHDQMVGEPYRRHIEAMDFIIKNQEDQDTRIVQCLEDAVENYRNMPDEHYWKEDLYIRADGEDFYLETKNIYYIETANTKHKVNIHIADRYIQMRGTMRELTAMLDSNQFYRCHNAYLVNILHIQEILPKESQLLLTNGTHLPVSARNFFGLKQLLKKLEKAAQHTEPEV